MAPEPAASSSLPCWPVTALLRKRLVRQDAELAELDEVFHAREDRVSELESSLAKSTPRETSLRSQVSALPTDLVALRADLTASQTSAATASSVLTSFVPSIGV